MLRTPGQRFRATIWGHLGILAAIKARDPEWAQKSDVPPLGQWIGGARASSLGWDHFVRPIYSRSLGVMSRHPRSTLRISGIRFTSENATTFEDRGNLQ
jgi:hypothetical protein